MTTLPTEPALTLAVLSAGVFFLTGLLTGIWKWRQTMESPDHRAFIYVDIAHRASLLYSFAALLLGVFALFSEWSDTVDLIATAVPLLYFAIATGTYVWHGVRRDVENQFAERNFVTTWGMWTLVVGEVGGFLVLFVGAAKTLLG